MKTGGRPAAGSACALEKDGRSRSWPVRNDSATLSDAELLKRGRELRWQAKTNVRLGAAFARSVRARSRSVPAASSGFQHFAVQIMGGIALFEGHVAEMQTGEGKTLTATLPAFLRGLTGRGCHIVTVNDYLAARDAREMGPIYERLGLSVGCIQNPMQTEERRQAYAKDITYGTAKEIGFDFLRDRLRLGADTQGSYRRRNGFGAAGAQAGEAPVQRGHYFALVDEGDSILIDEARTPLIIGLTQPNTAPTVNLLRWSQRAAQRLDRNVDFVFEPDRRSAYLTDHGCRKVLLMAKPSLMDRIDSERMYKHVEQALSSRLGFQRDRDYVVVDDKIVIVDESTGRQMEGRKWQDGLHQAVEAKELVPITAATGQAARVTVQTFFRQYEHLAGMTGTAVQARRELRATYGISVTPIPTNRPCIRTVAAAADFCHAGAQAAGRRRGDHPRCAPQGRALLVGTPSVDASEALGPAAERTRRCRTRFSTPVFTSKRRKSWPRPANRQTSPSPPTWPAAGPTSGCDPDVRRAGGLHVIATEMHSSARIDRQLVGRAARQGDPGSCQFFLSLGDELLRVSEARKARATAQIGPAECAGRTSEPVAGSLSQNAAVPRAAAPQRAENAPSNTNTSAPRPTTRWGSTRFWN